MVINNWN